MTAKSRTEFNFYFLKKNKAEATSRRNSLPPRMALFIALTIICLAAGILTGYSIIGDGSAGDAFKVSTWSHIYDLVEKK